MGDKQKTVFLDRDGTLNVDHGYVYNPEQIELFPDVVESLAILKKAGYRLVITSNQSAIGRGMCGAAEVEATNSRLLQLIQAGSNEPVIDEVCYCPHGPDDDCLCRKPGTGMVNHLLDTIDRERSWMIGDKLADVEFGLNLGLPRGQSLLILTGEGRRQLEKAKEKPEFVDSLREAVSRIVSKEEGL